jgi:hypothetical protein
LSRNSDPVLIVDHVVEQVIRASKPEWVPEFTGLSVRQFQRLVRIVARRGGAALVEGRRGRPWALSLADRVLLVAVYYRTNLTYRQIALLFGISKSAVDRVIDHLAPLLALSPATKKHSPDTVLIVDGMLVPTYDRAIAASSKNDRYSVNMQVVIDANTRLTVAVVSPRRQPQRLPRLPRLRGGSAVRGSDGDVRWRVPGQPRCDHALPQARQRAGASGVERGTEHRTQAGARSGGARLVPDALLEHPAHLPPCRRWCL